MSTTVTLAQIAALIGEPGRAAMLDALVRTPSLSAGELAAAAGLTPSTASGHLARLADGGLVTARAEGRRRCYRLASPAVARMLEAIMVVAGQPEAGRPAARRRIPPALRAARTCYDHIAGRLGVGLADALAARGLVRLDAEAGEVTETGRAFFEALGAPLAPPPGGRRPLCRPCLDWSERRPHIAGRLGAALLDCALDRHWVRRTDGRALTVTPEGARAFRDTFGVSLG
jgi:DNA-binding transcriptional ArsR family regulator